MNNLEENGKYFEQKKMVDGIVSTYKKIPDRNILKHLFKNVFEMEVENGLALTENIDISNYASIQRVIISPETNIGLHFHYVIQIIICTDGECIFTFENGDKKTIKVGEAITIPANIKHSVYFPIKSRCILVKIPPEDKKEDF